jgi:hypothetical protein
MLRIILIILLISIPVFCIGLTIYGLVLGFSAHILIGIVHLVITPLSFITGFTEFFFGVDLGQSLAAAFNL